MDLLSPKHLILILLIVLLVFGGRKLRNINSPIANIRAGRPLRLWLVAMIAIAALMAMAFALRLGY
jgi:hypothetical protein